jgi:hypothetical protein
MARASVEPQPRPTGKVASGACVVAGLDSPTLCLSGAKTHSWPLTWRFTLVRPLCGTR